MADSAVTLSCPDSVGITFSQGITASEDEARLALAARSPSDFSNRRHCSFVGWADAIEVNDRIATALVSPGATLISPLAVAGTNFSLGVGATFTTQAVRSEDYEFFLAFPEALNEFASKPRYYALYDGCTPEYGFLESDLDFSPILDRALAPVAAGTLYTGPQIGPGSSSAPAIPANEAANIRKAMNDIRNIPDIKTLDDLTFAQRAGRHLGVRAKRRDLRSEVQR